MGGADLELGLKLATLLATLTHPVGYETKEKRLCGAFLDGPAWIRTRDQRIMSPLL
jgi:hypothetical protein